MKKLSSRWSVVALVVGSSLVAACSGTDAPTTGGAVGRR